MSREPEKIMTETTRDGAKRSKRSVMLELILWALVSIAVAVAMVVLSERFLPTNF